MTIGIAAAGPRAGQAVLAGLKAAEAVGRGAIHGFVSFVAIGGDGRLHRAEVQDGGSTRLFGGGAMPAPVAQAERAGLMSSGPNRPEPLSQFTPADPAVGLVTGHRFPNMAGTDGVPLNLAVLDLMRRGSSPQAAVERIAAFDPAADAGYLAVSLAGEVRAADTAYLANFADAGRAVGSAAEGRSQAGVIHNAIWPHASLAGLVIETVLTAMSNPDPIDGTLTIAAGVPLQIGTRNALTIDKSGRVQAISVRDPRHLVHDRSFGLGSKAAVLRGSQIIGRALDEPFLRALDGRLLSINGRTEGEVRFTSVPSPVGR